MRAVKSTDTSPEILVRSALHRAGLRYRLHDKSLPGKPDLVFPKHRLLVFINGCYWHWHGCKRSRMPKTNTRYWQKKIGRNIERDKSNRAKLEADGWTVVVIWECSLEDGVRAVLQHAGKSL